MLSLVPEEAGRQLCLQCLGRDSAAAWACAWLGSSLCRSGQYEDAIPRLQVNCCSTTELCAALDGQRAWAFRGAAAVMHGV